MRTITSFNEQWDFYLDTDEAGVQGSVTLPHTWNALDGQDGGNDYQRGVAMYSKFFDTPADLGTDRLFIEFEAVNSIAKVVLNDKTVTQHEGGYSRFSADLTPFLNRDGEENALLVYADNRDSSRVYPSFADFTFFGGIYRDVKLIRVPESHFTMDFPGVWVRVEDITDEAAVCYAKAPVVTERSGLTVRFTVTGENAPETALLSAGEQYEFTIPNPRRWNGRKDPYLYRLKAVLLDGDRELDCIETEFGVRTFSVDPGKGFFLNGESYPLRGVCRHQDREDKGWAIGRAEMDEDMALICEIGANTLRLAHYQQNEYFYSLCDRMGIVVWAEIPFISRMLTDGHENELSQMRELVTQNYNHPSIVCWGLSNEITISSKVDEDLLSRHRALHELCHQLDPDRLTTMAQVSALPIESPMNGISDILSYNIYYGWYYGTVQDNAAWLDEFHQAHPDRCLGVSEYGCEAILSWHSETPEQGDYTEEYQAYYHEEILKIFAERPYLWATHVWNMFDFASDMRNEGGVKGRNHKGLVTFDRKTKKDSFYLYQAWWSDVPMLHLCGKRFARRAGETTRIKVYSNQKEAELWVNGQSLGKVQGDKVFTFDAVPLSMGENLIVAQSGDLRDEMRIERIPEADPAYIFRNGSGVENWFEGEKLDFPEGYFSIRDSISEIMSVPQGKALFAQMMSVAFSSGDMGMSMDEDMLRTIGSFSFERLASFAGDKLPKDMLLQINKQLNQIQKPVKEN